MPRKFNAKLSVAAALASLALGGTVAAQDATKTALSKPLPLPTTPAQKTVLDRQAHMEKMFASFNALYAEMIKDVPDVGVIRANTHILNAQATALPSWFPRGTGAEAGLPTRAKPEIWTDPPAFVADAEKLRSETGKLQALADAGNLPDMVDRIGWVSDTCGDCHKHFRNPPPSAH